MMNRFWRRKHEAGVTLAWIMGAWIVSSLFFNIGIGFLVFIVLVALLGLALLIDDLETIYLSRLDRGVTTWERVFQLEDELGALLEWRGTPGVDLVLLEARIAERVTALETLDRELGFTAVTVTFSSRVAGRVAAVAVAA